MRDLFGRKAARHAAEALEAKRMVAKARHRARVDLLDQQQPVGSTFTVAGTTFTVLARPMFETFFMCGYTDALGVFHERSFNVSTLMNLLLPPDEVSE